MRRTSLYAFFGILFIAAVLAGCDKRSRNGRTDTPTSGAITFASDESFAPIIEELVEQFEYKSNQVGIDNFKYRMKLLYDKKASFAFYNNDEGGAVSEITIWEVFG